MKLIRRKGLCSLPLTCSWYNADQTDTFLEAQNAKIRALEVDITVLESRIERLNSYIRKINEFHTTDIGIHLRERRTVEYVAIFAILIWPIIITLLY